MKNPKKCLRCEGENLKEWDVTVIIYITPYKNGPPIKKYKKEKCWSCEDCDSIIWYYTPPGHKIGFLQESNKEIYKEAIIRRYKKDELFKIKLLYKCK